MVQKSHKHKSLSILSVHTVSVKPSEFFTYFYPTIAVINHGHCILNWAHLYIYHQVLHCQSLEKQLNIWYPVGRRGLVTSLHTLIPNISCCDDQHRPPSSFPCCVRFLSGPPPLDHSNLPQGLTAVGSQTSIIRFVTVPSDPGGDDPHSFPAPVSVWQV